MGFWELLLLAVGLSTDAFAIAACAGLTMDKSKSKTNIKQALIIGLYFGGFQAAMPMIGYFAASLFAEKIAAYSHWAAFGLLVFLGGRMIAGSLKKEPASGKKENPGSLDFSGPAKMLPLALATSIDALAAGVSFAFLQVKIIPAAALIGATTFIISLAGVKTGNIFGAKLKSKAQLAGGVILALIGVKILLENLI